MEAYYHDFPTALFLIMSLAPQTGHVLCLVMTSKESLHMNPEIQSILGRLFAGFIIPDSEWDAVSDDDMVSIDIALARAKAVLIADDSGGIRMATAEEISHEE